MLLYKELSPADEGNHLQDGDWVTFKVHYTIPPANRDVPYITFNIGANVVRALHVVRARADVVDTKLGIILSSSFSFFPSTLLQ